MRSVKKKKTGISKRKILLVLGIALVLGCFSFYRSPYYTRLTEEIRIAYHALMKRSSLVLGQVNVEGHIRTKKEDINQILHLTQGMPILEVSLSEKQEQLMTLPWVQSVVIERHLPSTLYIRLTEKEPIAVWQNNQRYLPLDSSGKPIPDSQTPLPNLLLVVGEGAPEQTPALLKALDKYPDIRSKVRSAVRVSNRRWNLILNDAENGVVVKLPETEIEAALGRLSLSAEKEKIFKKDLSMIDLRQTDRLTIRLREGKK